jgi:hypothetical protein
MAADTNVVASCHQQGGGDVAKTATRRSATTLRIPSPLLRRIDKLAERTRRQLDPTWSRNAEIVALLADAVGRAEVDRA